MVVPDYWGDGRTFYEKLVDPRVTSFCVEGHTISVLMEEPREGYHHPCSMGDVAKLFSLFDIEHVKDIKSVVFRQPKRKEETLNPAWGRMSYFADINKHSGPAIFLDAQKTNLVMKWPKSLSPFEMSELERLKSDGHEIIAEKRHYLIKTTLESIRYTQLFRTIPHEIGHYAHYKEFADKLVGGTDENQKLTSKREYFSKPVEERERFAHKYAEEFYKMNSEKGLIPFDSISKES